MCKLPFTSAALSILAVKSSPIELRALPVIELTCVCRKLANAPLMAVLALAELLPSKYIPDANIVTASFERSSTLFVLRIFCISWSSGAVIINSTPSLGNCLVRLTPHSKSTILPSPAPLDTLVLTFSVAVILSVGFIGSPVNSR